MVFMLPPAVLIFLSNETIFSALKKIHTCSFMSPLQVYKFLDFSERQNSYEKSGAEATRTVPTRDGLRSLDSGDFFGSLTDGSDFDVK